MSIWYEVNLQPDDNGTFLATVPGLPEITTFGASQPEALHNAEAAIEEALAARIADSADIPTPLIDPSGKKGSVQMSLLTHLKLAIYVHARAQGVSRAELARRLKWHREQVDRLFRLDHGSRVDQLDAALKVLGVHIQFDTPLSEVA